MNELQIKSIELKIQNLMNIRTTYYSIAIVLNGGLIGLFYNITLINTILLIIGICFDFIILKIILHLSIRIDKLIRFMEKQ